MVRYQLNLLNIDESHPGAKSVLMSGGLSVRRSNKTFSRTPVDLTLEQTINADAASRSTGIVAFTNSQDARRRWLVTHAMRGAILSHLLKSAGLSRDEDAAKELTNHRIQRDNTDLEKIVKTIIDMRNPFHDKLQESKLFCLSTGRAASDETTSQLLRCMELGTKYAEAFKTECVKNPLRFEKPIPRRKIRNFASDAVKSKLTVKDKTIKELQGTRDLFGRLLYLSAKEKIDLSVVFAYPLTPVPLSLAHVDGSLHKTNKAALMHKLEGKITSGNPPVIEACVVDAMFLIRTLTNLPATFGLLAKLILEKLLAMGQRVDFVCDRYITPSIKDLEHIKRSSSAQGSTDFSISGSQQKRPSDFHATLSSGNFKSDFFRFLSDEWEKDEYAGMINRKTLVVGIEDHAYQFIVEDGTIQRTLIPELASDQEEADTRLTLHAKHISDSGVFSNIVVRSNDTDVLIILLTHAENMAAHIWMDAGLNKNNSRRYIDVSKLALQLGSKLCAALPGFHAFTGCVLQHLS